MQQDNKLIQKATAAFWEEFSKQFPEVTSGDSQLCGEDEGALAIWRYGVPGDRPTFVHDLPVDWTSEERITLAAHQGIHAAAKILFDGLEFPATPEPVLHSLKLCIKHVLHFNEPAQPQKKMDLADTEFEAYQFGDGAKVVEHDNWDTADPLDFTKIVYVRFNDDPVDADSHKISFHVRFAEYGDVDDVYGLDVDTGNEVGLRGNPGFSDGQEVQLNSTETNGAQGVIVTVIRRLSRDEVDEFDVGPMYLIRLADGSEQHAFADELLDLQHVDIPFGQVTFDIPPKQSVGNVHAKETSRSLAGKYPTKGSMPAKVVHQLYQLRETEVNRLSRKQVIIASDLHDLDRGARSTVANLLFGKCDATARNALLHDEHPHVRSCALIARDELETLCIQP